MTKILISNKKFSSNTYFAFLPVSIYLTSLIKAGIKCTKGFNNRPSNLLSKYNTNGRGNSSKNIKCKMYYFFGFLCRRHVDKLLYNWEHKNRDFKDYC